jgi:hypothetical protein
MTQKKKKKKKKKKKAKRTVTQYNLVVMRRPSSFLFIFSWERRERDRKGYRGLKKKKKEN